jgi:hypothetical protein
VAALASCSTFVQGGHYSAGKEESRARAAQAAYHQAEETAYLLEASQLVRAGKEGETAFRPVDQPCAAAGKAYQPAWALLVLADLQACLWVGREACSAACPDQVLLGQLA